MERHSLSKLVYLESLMVRDLLAKAVGYLSCVRTMPNTYPLVSVCMMMSFPIEACQGDPEKVGPKP